MQEQMTEERAPAYPDDKAQAGSKFHGSLAPSGFGLPSLPPEQIQDGHEGLPVSGTDQSAARLIQDGKPEEAVTLLNAALARSASCELWNNWATAQCACGNLDRAEWGYRRALRLAALDRQAAAVNLGLLLLAQGRLEEGVLLLQPHWVSLSQEEKQTVRGLAPAATERLEDSGQPMVVRT